MVGAQDFVLDPQVAVRASRRFDPTLGGDRDRLLEVALDLQSLGVREIAARLLGPDLDFSGVLEAARVGHVVAKDGAGGPLVSHLAAMTGLHHARASDSADALVLFEAARHTSPVSDWHARVAYAYVQMLWAAGRFEDLAADEELLGRLSPHSRRFLEVDLEGTRTGVGSHIWLQLLNGALAEMGAPPVELRDDEARSPFDRLTAAGLQPVDGDALITVIMAAYRPGPEIGTAVRSILSQTWPNLELLIVDDASGPDYVELFAALGCMDDRVRVLTQPSNRGAYAARNRALDEARGEFVTFQDADDWSHPQRLERQVLPLLGDATLVRSLSRSVRCTEGLVFQHLGSRPFRYNASSHLFRRSVLGLVGRFDWVRKSADTELDRRLETVLPGRRLEIREPLAFVRLLGDSLSRSDFLPGWLHPDRAEYRSAMLHWHEQIASGASPHMPAEVGRRPLSAPRPYLSGLGIGFPDIDVAYMADWTRAGAAERAALEEIQALMAAGTTVGVLHVRSATSPARARAPHAIAMRRLIADGSVTALTLEEATRVPTVVIRQPEVLEWPTSRPVALEAERVLVVADDVPSVEGSSEAFWTVADCDHNARALFGVEPWWWVRHDSDRQTVREVVGPARLLTLPVPRMLGCVGLRPGRPPQDRLVVGWIFEDASALPEPNQIRSVFPDDASVDVRLMGPRDVIKRRLGGIPAQWLVYDDGEISAEEFWEQIDVLAGFPERAEGERVLRAVYEGLSAGCALVLDHVFSAEFGDRAVYCTADQLPRILESSGLSLPDGRAVRRTAARQGGAIDDLASQGRALRECLLV